MNLLLLMIIGLPLAVLAALALRRRLKLSRAKHPSLRGHVRMARRIARLVPAYEFDESGFFRSDGAPAEVAERRRADFERLAGLFAERNPESTRRLRRLAGSVSDMQFVGRYRVPFPYSRLVRERLTGSVLVKASQDVRLHDIEGNAFLDLTGAYGVNVLGNDFYRRCMRDGLARVGELGAVLGPYHPVIEDNVARILAISGLDEISFHMSGTEAVMQAVRLARYHTGRSHVVRFCGAYHGWWDEVQPGVGNPGRVGQVYTLAEASEATLQVLESRRNIACVLVNPLQALHPNGNAPGDGALLASDRTAGFEPDEHARWLKRLREVCTARGIVVIFDEVFTGFRLARGGAQEYFGVQADMVTYGKTLGGGLPVGVLCGRAALMKRFREDRPADICFARGTFNSHPVVLGAMHEFLAWLDTAQAEELYDGLDARWNRRAARMNRAFDDAGLPLQVANLSSIFTVLYTAPSRYNWMLQFHLNAEGLLLPWVGTGRLIFSLNYSDDRFDEVVARFVAAAERMQRADWWWSPPGATNKTLKRQVLRELLARRFGSRQTPVLAPPAAK